VKLRYSAASPFARKVRVAAMETGQDGEIEQIETMVWDPETDIATVNPLGKVPALTADDGLVLCDSPLICEYLDSRHEGARLIPPAGPERWQVLNLQALGDGIMDAAVTQMAERRTYPPEAQSEAWMDRQRGKIAAALDSLEQEAAAGRLDGPAAPGTVTLGTITLGCALGYLDFRFAEAPWRDGRPALAAWYQAFARRPAMVATEPKDPT
jgi:glutathione S-transferase